jgi:hypothetical protein
MRVAGSGSQRLAALAVRIKAEAPTGLRVELLRGLKAGAAPLIPKVHDAAIAQLPHAGGLNEQVAGQKVTVQVRMGAKTAGVRLKTTAPDTKQTDEGWVRHPVFSMKTTDRQGKTARIAKVNGHYSESASVKWRTQQIPAAKGWWSATLAKSAPKVTPALMAAMKTVAAKIQGGV